MKGQTVSNEIFVGGLPQDCPEELITEYFNQWGAIQKVEYKFGRGFAFLTFADEMIVDQILQNRDQHQISGKWVEAKKAENRRGQSGGGGGYGGGAAGYGGGGHQYGGAGYAKDFGGKNKGKDGGGKGKGGGGFGGGFGGGKDKGYGGGKGFGGGKGKGKGKQPYDAW